MWAPKKVRWTRPTTVTYNEIYSPMSAKHCTFACVLLTARIYDFDLLFYTLFTHFFLLLYFRLNGKKGFVLGHISCVYECFFCHSVCSCYVVYIDVNVVLDQAPWYVHCQPAFLPVYICVCVSFILILSFWSAAGNCHCFCVFYFTPTLARIGVFSWVACLPCAHHCSCRWCCQYVLLFANNSFTNYFYKYPL